MNLIESIPLPTKYGNFTLLAFAKSEDEKMPIVVLKSEITSEAVPLLRIHSECFTGDLLGSYRCDCGEQLDASLQRIADEGGYLIYLRQEGRGIGLLNKIKAYKIQDQGVDTAHANIHLGFEPDQRSYDEALEILEFLQVDEVILLTNNPEKLEALERSDKVTVRRREPLVIQGRTENQGYMETKKEFFGHWL